MEHIEVLQMVEIKSGVLSSEDDSDVLCAEKYMDIVDILGKTYKKV